MTPYTDRIEAMAPDYDPKQVECFMRLAYSTLDGLSRQQFRREVDLACQCIDADPEMARRLVASYGM